MRRSQCGHHLRLLRLLLSLQSRVASLLVQPIIFRQVMLAECLCGRRRSWGMSDHEHFPQEFKKSKKQHAKAHARQDPTSAAAPDGPASICALASSSVADAVPVGSFLGRYPPRNEAALLRFLAKRRNHYESKGQSHYPDLSWTNPAGELCVLTKDLIDQLLAANALLPPLVPEMAADKKPDGTVDTVADQTPDAIDPDVDTPTDKKSDAPEEETSKKSAMDEAPEAHVCAADDAKPPHSAHVGRSIVRKRPASSGAPAASVLPCVQKRIVFM